MGTIILSDESRTSESLASIVETALALTGVSLEREYQDKETKMNQTQKQLDETLAKAFSQLTANVMPKLEQLIKARFAAKRIPTIEERAKAYDFTVEEMQAFDPVAQHVVERLTSGGFSDVTLSGYVLSRLMDAGTIEGHSFTGDTLEQYSAPLASALRKLDLRLKRRGVSPLLA